MTISGCAIFHVETVSLPDWITNPDMCERGERTFFDGEWYFNQDKDGNDIGPYRYTLVYAIRSVLKDIPMHLPEIVWTLIWTGFNIFNTMLAQAFFLDIYA